MFPECPFWKWDQLPLASTWCYKLQTTQTVFIPQPTKSESIMEEIFALLLYFQRLFMNEFYKIRQHYEYKVFLFFISIAVCSSVN